MPTEVPHLLAVVGGQCGQRAVAKMDQTEAYVKGYATNRRH